MAGLILWRWRRRLLLLSRWAAGHVGHRVLLSRGFWSSSTITILDAISLAIFLSVNFLLSATGGNIANLALINLLPLFLGGHTNLLADYLRIPLPIYQFAHRWLGRVVIAQALLHSAQRFSLAEGPGKLAGLATAGLLLLIFVTSLLPVRRWKPTLFRWAHLILSISVLCGLGSHTVLTINSSLSFPSIPPGPLHYSCGSPNHYNVATIQQAALPGPSYYYQIRGSR